MKLIIGAYLREIRTIPVTINIMHLALWAIGRRRIFRIKDYEKFSSYIRGNTKNYVSVTWGKPAVQKKRNRVVIRGNKWGTALNVCAHCISLNPQINPTGACI